MRARLLGIVLLACLLAGPDARAADGKSSVATQQQFRTHVENGLRLFRDQRFDDAIREYLSAYAINSNPVLLFNIGQAHRKAGRLQEARRAYEQFKEAAPDSPLVPEAEAHVLAARAGSELARLEAERTTAEQTARAREKEAERLALLNEALRKQVEERLLTGAPSQHRRPLHRRGAFWAVLGSGTVIALGLGLGLGLGLPKEPDPGLGVLMVVF